MFEIKTPDGFTYVKQLSCRKEYGRWFSYNYDIEIISIIQDSEGNFFIRQYSNCCDSGANGRPITSVRDVGFKIDRKYHISRIKSGNWKKYISLEELLHPSIVFESTSDTYVDQDALDFVKNST